MKVIISGNFKGFFFIVSVKDDELYENELVLYNCTYFSCSDVFKLLNQTIDLFHKEFDFRFQRDTEHHSETEEV